ncbi:MAG: hypothetical protein HKN30_08905 [Sulfitobacter sp.]|nr:hypothetical protein [Sulfitobacter sp.]
MSRALFLGSLLWLCSMQIALADARLTVLVDVLKLDEATQILSLEGQDYAQKLNDEMLNGQGGPGWQQQVAAIYDPNRMAERVRTELASALQGEMREVVIDFYSTDLGGRIVELENSARRAIGNPDVEAAARDRYAALAGTDDPRLARVTAYIEAGDMITRNVTSAMNANLLFMRGLAEGDAVTMSEEDMLADVQGDMEETTADTTAWLFAYLLLAYHPLSDDDLDTYIAFARTEAGRALNRALFDGFGQAYEDISYSLGLAVALNMRAEEL